MAIADIAIQIVTKGANLAKKQLDGLGNSANKSGGMMSKLATAGKVAGIAVGVALVKGITKATQEFISFNDKMTQSLAIMDTTIEQQKDMEAQALAVSRTTRISAEQSAEAYFFLASAGLNAEQSISALPQVAKFAQAGMFDMATATDLATDAQSALGLTVSDAQQNLTNLTRVTDVLVKANTLANASVQQFSEALTNKAGSALKVTGKSIEEGVAVLSAFADRGVKGAEAGEKLNQLLRDIPRATAKNSEEFAKLGLAMFDNEGKLKNVADLVEELDRVLAPMSDELKASTLDQLGLNRGVADAVKILSGASAQIRDYESALNDSGGTTADVAENQMGSLKAQIELMTNAFSELGILIGDTIAPALSAVVGFITKIITKTSDFVKAQKEQTDAVEESARELVIAGQVIEKNTHVYNPYSQALFEATTNLVDNRSATEKAIDAQRGLERANRNSIPSYMEVTDQAIAQAEANRENAESTQEATEASVDRANAMKKNLLPTLDAVIQAQNKLKDIEQRVADAESDRDDASKKVTKAQNLLEKASTNVREAEEKLAKAKEDALKVTLEEQLAIARQKETIQKLEEAENKSEVQKLQLAVAREKLTQLEAEATGVTREQESAQRELTRALEEEERAFDKLTQAEEKLIEAQKELNEVTAKTPENLLEIAMAKAELDNALTNLNALGTFDDALSGLVESTGMKLQDLINMALTIQSGGTDILKGTTSTGTTYSTDGVPSDTVPTAITSPNQIMSLDKFNAGGAVGQSSANIVVNVGGALSSSDEITEAVAEAIIKAQKQGIKVLL